MKLNLKKVVRGIAVLIASIFLIGLIVEILFIYTLSLRTSFFEF